MLENLSALAIVPKAKAIAARRLSHGDYLELMRKRSVIEVTAALQSHPYFKDSLKGLSQTNLHRAQIEEALSKDVYYKYESLMRYSFRKGKFGAYFLMRSEINELLAKLRLLSMGFRHHYIIQVPGFLMPKTSFSLLRLAKAESAQDCLEVVAGTPYAKVLAGVLPAAGQKLDYLKCEHAFQTSTPLFWRRSTATSPAAAQRTQSACSVWKRRSTTWTSCSAPKRFSAPSSHPKT